MRHSGPLPISLNAHDASQRLGKKITIDRQVNTASPIAVQRSTRPCSPSCHEWCPVCCNAGTKWFGLQTARSDEHGVADCLAFAALHVEGPPRRPWHDAFEEELELVRDVIDFARRKNVSRGNARRAAAEIAHLVGLPCLSNCCDWGSSAAQPPTNQGKCLARSL